MNIVFLLIPLGMVLMVVAVAALFWAVNSGQYDDLEDAGRAVVDRDDEYLNWNERSSQSDDSGIDTHYGVAGHGSRAKAGREYSY
jgi:cbb3-type cytochrome oxidase maturation protein